ncbi:MAG: hypothetical protein IPH12_01020 [Saprospirales bacterium]|nr:hypothetical protein [Saprospirales bacterium]
MPFGNWPIAGAQQFNRVFSHPGIRILRVLRRSTRVKSYNLVISLIARLRARLIQRQATGSLTEPFLLHLPPGISPGGFSVFGADFSISNIFSENNFCAARGNAGSGHFFLAGMARQLRVAPAFLILINRFILYSQKNG